VCPGSCPGSSGHGVPRGEQLHPSIRVHPRSVLVPLLSLRTTRFPFLARKTRSHAPRTCPQGPRPPDSPQRTQSAQRKARARQQHQFLSAVSANSAVEASGPCLVAVPLLRALRGYPASKRRKLAPTPTPSGYVPQPGGDGCGGTRGRRGSGRGRGGSKAGLRSGMPGGGMHILKEEEQSSAKRRRCYPDQCNMAICGVVLKNARVPARGGSRVGCYVDHVQ
jgi:hypothetical protein